MKTQYDADYVEVVLNTFYLVEREAEHLGYTHCKLSAKGIDLAWVSSLANQPDEAEILDAFAARFGRLQDTLGDKLLPRFAQLLGEVPKSLIDTLSFAERQGWVNSGDDFIMARRLRNKLVHEYMLDPAQFLEALLAAVDATVELLAIVGRLRECLDELGLSK